MKKKSIWIVVACVAVVLACVFFYKKRANPPSAHPASVRGSVGSSPSQGTSFPVRVASIQIKDMPVMLSAIGSVTPSTTSVVRSRVTGELLSLHFTEGGLVKKGDLLAQIDPRTYQASLQQAQAQLAGAKANLRNAQADLRRYETLLASDAIAKQTVESQRNTVDQLRAIVQSDEANVTSAKLELDFTRIVAPVSGRVGLRLVDVGNQVLANDTTGIVTITQSDSNTVVFSLSEIYLPKIARALSDHRTLSVTVSNRDNSSVLAKGTLESINNQIDTATGTFKLRATIGTHDATLFPNQFVNVALELETLNNALVVPSNAVLVGRDGNYMWVLNDDMTVRYVPVQVVYAFNEESVITGDVSGGLQVATDGVDRLRAGSSVIVAGEAGRSEASRRAEGSSDQRDDLGARSGPRSQ